MKYGLELFFENISHVELQRIMSAIDRMLYRTGVDECEYTVYEMEAQGEDQMIEKLRNS